MSLGFRSEAWSDLLTGCFFFCFFFSRDVSFLNRENLERGAKLARMDREAQRRVAELEAGLNSEDLSGFMPQKCAFVFAGVRAQCEGKRVALPPSSLLSTFAKVLAGIMFLPCHVCF